MDLEEQYDKLFRYCYFKLCDKQLAQDITQETFLRYYRRNIRLENGKELAYLYTIAGNLCTDAFRQRPLGGYYIEDKYMGTNYEMDLVDQAYARAFNGRTIDQNLMEETIAAYRKIPKNYQTFGFFVLMLTAVCLSGIFTDEHTRKTD